MRPTVPGFSIAPETRAIPKAFNYFYSLLPRVNSGDGNIFDPIEFRLRPGESRDFPVVFDADSQFFKWFIRFEVANEYADAALAGSFSDASAGTNVLTGVGTNFIRDLKVGDVIWLADLHVQYLTVAKIIDATHLVTVEALNVDIFGEDDTFYGKMLSRNIPYRRKEDGQIHIQPLTGTVSADPSSGQLHGTGTMFTTELVVGDKIRLVDDTGTERFYIIAVIFDDLTANIQGFVDAVSTLVPLTKFYTDYTDIEFSIFASGGGGQRFLGGGRVLSNQGTNGGGSPETIPGSGAVAAIRRPYLYGKAGACTVRVHNLVNDARRVHAHLFGVRIRI